MSEWKEVSLHELTDGTPITYGVVKPGKEDLDGVLFIRSGDLVRGNIRITQLRTISSEISKQYKRTILHGGELLISLVGNPGEVAIVPPSLQGANIARQVGLIRFDLSRVNPHFMKYFFMSGIGKGRLLANSIGSVQNVINLKELKEVTVPLPELQVQVTIAKIFQVLDQKIDLLRQQNETLEQIAQTLFKRWFVEFEFPYDFARGAPDPNGQPYKSSGGKMAPSELGEIPEGWRVGVLGDLASINPREALKKGEISSYVDMRSLSTKGMEILGHRQRKFTSGSKFRNHDTLLARITPCLENGKTAYVNFLNEDEIGWGSTEFVVMRPKNVISKEYTYCLARDENFRAYAIKNMTGSSGRKRVPNDVVEQFPVAIPDPNVIERYTQICSILFCKIKTNQNSTKRLEKLRKLLLPKLMSGQIRVNSN